MHTRRDGTLTVATTATHPWGRRRRLQLMYARRRRSPQHTCARARQVYTPAQAAAGQRAHPTSAHTHALRAPPPVHPNRKPRTQLRAGARAGNDHAHVRSHTQEQPRCSFQLTHTATSISAPIRTQADPLTCASAPAARTPGCPPCAADTGTGRSTACAETATAHRCP